jgi:flagellar basal-body rod protein FlgB
MISTLDQALSFQSTALKMRAERQGVLSANIANADTPNYKAVDFDFSQALARATGEQGASAGPQPVQLAVTAAGHTAGTTVSSTLPVQMQYRTPSQDSVDGNTVEMDSERAQFAENAVHYEAALKFLNGQIKTMLSALQSPS